jgi:hypothetical protein
VRLGGSGVSPRVFCLPVSEAADAARALLWSEIRRAERSSVFLGSPRVPRRPKRRRSTRGYARESLRDSRRVGASSLSLRFIRGIRGEAQA